MKPDIDTIDGVCHCGGVRLSDGLHTSRRCNCSYCRMRGAVAVSAAWADIEILDGADRLSCYQFDTRIAKHYFCSHCGIDTHHQRRSNPPHYGVNVACLDGLSPFDCAEVPVANGVEHPSDKDDRRRASLAGVLRYEAVD